MEIIVQGRNNIKKLLAVEMNKDILYRKSTYLLQCKTDAGELLCNSLTGELVLLSPQEEALINQNPIKACVQLSELIRCGFLVPVECNEYKLVEQLRAIFLKQRETREIINQYNILPTTACNARCFYCYESNIKHVNMSEETAEKLVSFIVNHYGNTKIKLSWYGGEPTLGIDRIDQICEGLRQKNISYESEMVSNAYLFDEKLVRRAKDLWNLKTIQITLDGTEEIYNKTKSYVGIKDNAFIRVLRNIKLFLDEKIYVNIRLNMDDHNTDDLIDLTNELSEKFQGEKYLAIYVRQLDENVGYAPIQHGWNDIQRLGRRYIELQDMLENKGWPQVWQYKLPSLVTCSCMADDPAYVQCTPDGIFSKCEDKIYEHVIGSLNEGINNRNEINWWRERAPYDRCPDCPILPSCRKLLKNCPVRTPDCVEDNKNRRMARYYDTMLKEYEHWQRVINNSWEKGSK